MNVKTVVGPLEAQFDFKLTRHFIDGAMIDSALDRGFMLPPIRRV